MSRTLASLLVVVVVLVFAASAAARVYPLSHRKKYRDSVPGPALQVEGAQRGEADGGAGGSGREGHGADAELVARVIA